MPTRILRHPLASHLLARLRDKRTQPADFRIHCRSLTSMLVLDATWSIATRREAVETPLEATEAEVLAQGLAVVPVLRAGLGMLEPILGLFPDVAVGYIGLERDHETAVAHSYYCKLPKLEDRFTLCVDPMLATGGSATQAVTILKEHGARKIAMVSVVATPEGVNRFDSEHPDVEIVTAAVDRGLNIQKYIVPGLGDFGDRLFGTL
ncbi:MAG: uracil phosphoribosyltransferase [Fimbriimonadaceae bacterium]